MWYIEFNGIAVYGSGNRVITFPHFAHAYDYIRDVMKIPCVTMSYTDTETITVYTDLQSVPVYHIKKIEHGK